MASLRLLPAGPGPCAGGPPFSLLSQSTAHGCFKPLSQLNELVNVPSHSSGAGSMPTATNASRLNEGKFLWRAVSGVGVHASDPAKCRQVAGASLGSNLAEHVETDVLMDVSGSPADGTEPAPLKFESLESVRRVCAMRRG